MENKEKLIELIPIYKHNKSEADNYKKLADKYCSQIKDIMLNDCMSEFVFDNIKATCTKSYREEFIEEALIQKLKDLGVNGVIKTKEYVDMDALENAIYNGDVSAAELASCQTRKEVVTLRVTTIKK